MKLFKSIANWLFSEERAELKELISDLNVVKQTLTAPKPRTSPVSSARMVGTELIVVLHDGSIVTKSNATDEDFAALKIATTMADVTKVLVNKTEIKEDEPHDLFNECAILKGNPDFQVDEANKKVYFKGVGLAIPSVIVATFVEILEKKKMPEKYNLEDLNKSYEALVMFWLKLAMNPLDQCREDILTFIKNNDVHITKYGNMVLYRRIVSKNADKKKKEYFKLIA